MFLGLVPLASYASLVNVLLLALLPVAPTNRRWVSETDAEMLVLS